MPEIRRNALPGTVTESSIRRVVPEIATYDILKLSQRKAAATIWSSVNVCVRAKTTAPVMAVENERLVILIALEVEVHENEHCDARTLRCEVLLVLVRLCSASAQ